MSFKKTTMAILAFTGLAAALCGQAITVTAPNGGERWMLGDPVTITWTSSGLAGDARIQLMRSGGALVGTIAAAVPIAGGSYAWTAGALTSGAAAAGENYVIRVRAVGSEPVDDSDAPFALVGRLPNIHCASMREIGHTYTFLPPVFAAGETVTIKYYLRNDSAFSAGPFHVGLRVGGTIVARNAYAELVNGGEASGEFAWTAVCGAAVAVVADCDGEVEESNEGDNVMTDPGLVCSQPDLNFFRALSCSSGNSTAKAGLRYEFRAQVDATPVQAESVRVIGGIVGGARLYDHTFPILVGDGGQEDVSFIWEVPEGAHRVYFEIDPDNTVAESNERNNRQELAITGVVSTPATERYDLRVTLTRPRAIPPARSIEARVGAPLAISGEVRGATGAIRDFKVSAWVVSKTLPRTRIYTQDFIDPGMSVVPFSFSWTPTVAGECTVQVIAELGAHAIGVGVVDVNPANNSAKFMVSVATAPPALKRR